MAAAASRLFFYYFPIDDIFVFISYLNKINADWELADVYCYTLVILNLFQNLTPKNISNIYCFYFR